MQLQRASDGGASHPEAADEVPDATSAAAVAFFGAFRLLSDSAYFCFPQSSTKLLKDDVLVLDAFGGSRELGALDVV